MRGHLVASAWLVFGSSSAWALDVTFDGTGGGAAATDWVGVVAGTQTVVDFDDDGAGTKTWTITSTFESTPSLPVPRQSEALGRGMYDIIQFIVDWVLAYSPTDPNELQALTGFSFNNSMMFTNDEVGLFIQTNGVSSLGTDPTFEGGFEASLEEPMSRAEPVYFESGLVVPAGPGAAWLEGQGIVPLADIGEDFVVDVSGFYFFDPDLELAAPYEYEYGGSYETLLDDPLTWQVSTTYVERQVSVAVPSGVGSHVALRAAPSPFSASAAIEFDQPHADHVRVTVLDVGGRLVRTLLRGRVTSGPVQLAWDGRDEFGRSVAPGVYFLERADSVSRSGHRLVKH